MLQLPPAGLLTRRARARLVTGVLLAVLALTCAVYTSARLAAALAVVVFVAALVSAPRPRWRRRAAGIAFGVATGAALLAVCDLAARTFLPDRLHFRSFERWARKWPVDPRTCRFVPDIEETREVHGDLAERTGDPAHAQRRTVRFRSDAHGFRNDALPARSIDALVLGDSFGLGEGTSQDETWAALLSRAGFETYNLSMPSGPGEQALRLAWEAPRLPLRQGTALLWTLFAGNDLWDAHPGWSEPLTPAPWLDQLVTRARSFRMRSPLRTALRRLPGDVVVTSDGAGPVLFFEPYVRRTGAPADALRAHARVPALRETFAWMRGAAARLGLRVLVIIAPDKSEVHPELLGRAPPSGRTAFAEVVRGLAEEAGFPWLDLRPGLVAARDAEPEPLYWRDDTHWSPRGNRETARLVLERLRALGLTPSAGPVADAATRGREPGEPR